MVLLSIFNNRLLDQLEFNEDSNKIFIYIVNINDYKQDVSQFWQYLSIQEQRQAKKYYPCYLSDRYIVSHGILRCLLGYYTRHLPHDIQFSYNKYTKPFLKDHKIQFNMSHSHEMVGYIIALNNHVGIDIELRDNSLDIQELSDLVFTPIEYELFSTLETQEKYIFFYNLWTKKESLIKASGQGLSYPLNAIETTTSLASSKIILLTNQDNNKTKEWHSFSLEETGNYSGCIAIEHKVSQIIYLKMNKKIFDRMSLAWLN